MHEIPSGAALRDRSATGRGVWCSGLVPDPVSRAVKYLLRQIPKLHLRTVSEFSEVATDMGSLKQLPTPVQQQHWEPLGD